jgi:hypothetical protein
VDANLPARRAAVIPASLMGHAVSAEHVSAIVTASTRAC